MDKFKFLILIFELFQFCEFLSAEKSIWSLNLSSKTELDFSLEKENEENSEAAPVDFTADQNLALKFTLQNFTLSLASKSQSLSPDYFSSEEFFSFSLENFNFYNFYRNLIQAECASAKYSFSPQKLPFSAVFLAGNLKYSGSASRMKNPSFSSPSPLKKSILLEPEISISEASSPSSSQTLSLAADFSFPFLNFQCAYLYQSAFYASAGKKFSFQNSSFPSEIAFSLSGAFISSQNSSLKEKSWNLSKPYYAQKYFFSSEGLFNFSSTFFNSSCALQISENPFGNPQFCARNQNSLHIENFLVNCAFFLAPQNFFTADTSEIKSYFQYYLNPQYTFFLPHSDLEGGFLFQQNFCSSHKRCPEFYKEFLTKMNLSLNFSRNSFLWQSSFFSKDLFLNAEDKEFSQKISWKLNAKNLSTKLSFQWKKEISAESENSLYSANFYFYPKRIFLKTISSAVSLEEKNSILESLNFSSAANFLFSTKNLKVRIKIAAECKKEL